jgi:hypothetical protein
MKKGAQFAVDVTLLVPTGPILGVSRANRKQPHYFLFASDHPGVRETTLFLITTGKKKSAAATICGCPPFEIGLDMSPDSNGTLPSTVDGTNKIKGA